MRGRPRLSSSVGKETFMSIPDPLIGRQLGDYGIVDLLGRGGMARVYRGYDEKLDRYAAVKVIDAALMATDSEEEYRQRFLREARAIARLRHPSIVGIYSFGDIDNLYYMVMEFVEGRDLAVMLRENGGASFTPAQILRVIHDISGALDYAHAGGVIHRDIKPSNIMVRPDGHAVLTDFGLALSVPEGSMGNTFGSAHYIAPEQAISSAQAVPQSDLYSLGVVLFQMLTGRVPFDDPSAMTVALKHLSDPPPSPRDFNPAISEAVEAVVLKMLEKEPQDRYRSGEAFARALEVALGITASGEPFAPPGSQLTTTEMNVLTGDAPANTIALKTDAPSPPLVQTPSSKPSKPTSIKPFPEIKQLSPEAYSGTSLRPPMPEPEYLEPDADQAAPPAAPRSVRRGWLAALAALIVIAVALIALSGGGNDSSDETSRTETSIAGAVVIRETSTSQPTTAPAASRTSAPVISSTAERTTPASTSAPTETSQPTDAPTLPPATAVETLAAPPTEPAFFADDTILLVYDGDTLVLSNPTDDTVNISGLLFIQRRLSGDRAFLSDLWSGGSRPVWSLPSGDCFQVWRVEVPERDVPAGCQVRHAWRSIASQRWFWLSEDPTATFDVMRGETTLATCRVNIGTCAVPLTSPA